MALQIHTIVSMPFAENTYVLWNPGNPEAVVIDPGLDPDAIVEFLYANQLQLAVILNTHGHADHIAGNGPLKQLHPDVPLLIGVNDEPLLHDPILNVSRSFGFDILSPAADRLLHDGDEFTFANISFKTLEIPGHSPGHIAFLVKGEPNRVFGGDILFRDGIGRTDFPGGSFATLASGIRQKLFPLSPDTVIYPGHGPVTTIGYEQANNSFLRG